MRPTDSAGIHLSPAHPRMFEGVEDLIDSGHLVVTGSEVGKIMT